MKFEARIKRKGYTRIITLNEANEHDAMMEAAQKGRVLWIKQVH